MAAVALNTITNPTKTRNNVTTNSHRSTLTRFAITNYFTTSTQRLGATLLDFHGKKITILVHPCRCRLWRAGWESAHQLFEHTSPVLVVFKLIKTCACRSQQDHLTRLRGVCSLLYRSFERRC